MHFGGGNVPPKREATLAERVLGDIQIADGCPPPTIAAANIGTVDARRSGVGKTILPIDSVVGATWLGTDTLGFVRHE
jgi:hypothetical protein